MEPIQPTNPGPVSAGILTKLSDLPNNYPDAFDYSVYDKLSEKFGKKQPRGGVVFKTTFRLVNYNSSCSKCHYAFEIDTYGRGCTHNCTYCYALELLTGYGYWNRPHPMPVDIAEIRKVFATVFETDKRSKWRSIMEKRIPLRIGSMSDSFMRMDRKYKVTYELLKILRFYRYPYIVFTRSDLIADDQYLEVLDRELASVQFSISGGDEKLTKLIEPGAPTVGERLIALQRLTQAGFWTTVRINPLFPIFPDGYYTDRDSLIRRFGSIEKIPRFPLFDLAFIRTLAETKVPSILAGVVRLSPVALNGLSRSTGINLKDFFKPELNVGGGDRHYSGSEVAFYYKMIQSECAKFGMRFSTCYIGNGIEDYYRYQELWSNKSDCCDARGNVNAFNSSSQDVPWNVRGQFSNCKQKVELAQVEEGKADEAYLH